MYKPFLGISVLIVLVWGAYSLLYVPTQPTASPSEITVADVRFEIVDTEDEREQGLSGRHEVPSDYGMLFVFPERGQYGFWMKDMYVPIDILWLADDGTVLAIDREVATSTYPSAFYPPEPVRLVLETKAGEAMRKGWEVGSVIPLPTY